MFVIPGDFLEFRFQGGDFEGKCLKAVTQMITLSLDVKSSAIALKTTHGTPSSSTIVAFLDRRKIQRPKSIKVLQVLTAEPVAPFRGKELLFSLQGHKSQIFLGSGPLSRAA